MHLLWHGSWHYRPNIGLYPFENCHLQESRTGLKRKTDNHTGDLAHVRQLYQVVKLISRIKNNIRHQLSLREQDPILEDEF